MKNQDFNQLLNDYESLLKTYNKSKAFFDQDLPLPFLRA